MKIKPFLGINGLNKRWGGGGGSVRKKKINKKSKIKKIITK